MEKWKKWKPVLGTIIFLAIGLALAVAASYVLRRADNARTKIAGFYAEEKDSLDVIGMGSSAMYRYVNSPQLWEETGMTSYIMATQGQPIYTTEHLINEVNKTQSPQLLIIETRKFTKTDDTGVNVNRFRTLADNMKYSFNRFDMINKVIEGGLEEKLPYYFDIMMYHENWENLKAKNYRYITNERPYRAKSWFDITVTVPIEKPDVADVTEELPISEAAESELRSIIEKCRKEQMEVLFLATPWEIDEENQMNNNYLKRIIEESGYHFLDLNRYTDEIGLDFEIDFYNRKHTNSVGAKKVTTFIGNYIRETYDIQTTHSKKVKKSWDAAAKENRENYQKCEAEVIEKAKKQKELGILPEEVDDEEDAEGVDWDDMEE